MHMGMWAIELGLLIAVAGLECFLKPGSNLLRQKSLPYEAKAQELSWRLFVAQINANVMECYLRQSIPKYINFLFCYSKCSIKFFSLPPPLTPHQEHNLNRDLVPSEIRLLTCYFLGCNCIFYIPALKWFNNEFANHNIK